MKIGYLGPKGTFAEEATLGYIRVFGDIAAQWDTVPLPTKLDVLEAVSCGQLDIGIVPIENSIEGSVSETIDGLLRFPNLFIQDELVLPIVQNLMGLPGSTVESLTEIWSHPQGLAQSRSWIHGRSVSTVQYSSTAAAAKAVSDSKRTDVAAIANKAAADAYQLKILVPNVHDEAENHTRFIVVVGDQQIRGTPVKTMLLLTPSAEKAGVLAAILNVLAALELNLTWIESRPTKRKLGTYQFLMDVECGLEEGALQKALSILKTLGHDVRTLGSYSSTPL